MNKCHQIITCISLGAALALGINSAAAREPWKAPAEGNALVNPLPSTGEVIAKGKAIYDNRCADCHGAKGRGDGAGGSDLDVRPTDFTKAAFAAQSDGDVFWKISKGRKPMPGYGNKLNESDRWELVVFLRSLAK